MKISSNKTFYYEALKEFGISAQGVHWNNKYTQYKRFEVLTKLIKKEIRSASIVDVGCGFGEYYQYLKNNKKLPASYIGVDCESNMVNISRKRFPEVQFFVQNILEDPLIVADYYICSGALNILTLPEITIFIQKCYKHSKKGFAFNYLKNVSFKNIKEDQIFAICRKLSHNIMIKEGYLENDFTVFMVK